MIEHREIDIRMKIGRKRNRLQAIRDLIRSWNMQARLRENPAERIDVVGDYMSAAQRRFDDGRSASREGIVNNISCFGVSVDEVFRKLRLEACPVRHLVQRACLTLFCSPEFADAMGDYSIFHV